ncbi:TetR/AcrR family transcriptional regulator [Oricola thermophila]|uniref:TetR/AcrR family transcriptional regulator n=1 Tax=Oricola thermophila TaxID=2742145 RepID=A0A6N1V885_9HYPH|nr:TetR/AcrR family transcriptional regulator [Oricola thermophila]QKV17166.1 TetR/AcrR family transcriptional regulator [Oricola thermophila]
MSSKITDTRTRILQSAWKLLEKGNGNEIRMSDIAREAGISRQALYLHFPTRAELLIATTRHIDAVNDIDTRLAPSRSAASGIERLDAFIEAWGDYIPLIHGVARALISMQDEDDAARIAWADRLRAVREGFEAAVGALDRDGVLSPDYTPKQATDLLWTLVSIENWEHLVIDCNWSQSDYVEAMKSLARRVLVIRATG